MAQDAAATLTSGELAPSELVVLNGQRFTTAQVLLGATGDTQVELLTSEAKVSATQLGQAVLAVALLANDRAGTIRLDPRQKKTLLGLSSEDTLYADPDTNAVDWPASSLEARVCSLAEQLYNDKGRHEVVEIVAELLPGSPDPWVSAVDLVKAGLGARGLLETTEVADLKILRRWVLPESTRALAAKQSVSPVEQLVADCERDRPEVWNRLVDQIKQAVTRRTERDASAT